jgi:HlyD family secretion protein
VSKARTELAQRKRELDRAQGLIKQQFVSQNEVDVAVTAHEGALAQLEVAEAAVKQADAALQSAELDLKYTVIRSPVNGSVISRQVEVGQRLSASVSIPTLFLIAEDVTKMQVDTNVSEADIGGITEGKDATFTVDAYPGELFHGRVRQVRNAPISVQNVVTYDVVVEVDNPAFRLKPGMTANVSIIVARKDGVLKVPNAALRFTPPKSEWRVSEAPAGHSVPITAAGQAAAALKTIWKMGPSGELEVVSIQPGVSDGMVTEVVSGDLKEKDEVIVGIESPRGERKSETLPPGFGAGQRSSPRDRGH